MPRRRVRFVSTLALTALAIAASSTPAFATEDETWLVRLDTTDEAVLESLLDAGLRPVAIAPDYAVALATPTEQQRADWGEARPIRLARLERGAHDYIVYLGGGRAAEADLGDLGTVLYRGELSAVLRADPRFEERLFEQFRTLRIPEQPLRFSSPTSPRADSRGLSSPPALDAAVAEMVRQVEAPALQAQVQALQDFGTRRSNTSGGTAAQRYLVERFTSMGYARVWTHDYNSAFCDNVIAEKQGAVTPERIFVIGGHYDSISSTAQAPGADDNASGMTGVLEAARILAPYTFESTIYFIGWSGEEQGLVGSAAWCNWAVSQGLDIAGYINLDMEGYRADAKDLDLIVNGNSVWLRDLVAQVAPLYVPDLPVVDGYLGWGTSDHASFWSHGYDAVFFFEDSDAYSPFIHSSQDRIGPSLNDFEFMKENVQAAIATLATLAVPVPIVITHTPLSDSQNIPRYFEVEALVHSILPLLEDSLSLSYRVNEGPPHRVSMRRTGQPGGYRAYIPATAGGTAVHYFIQTRDTAGHIVTSPRGAPSASHTFVVGLYNVLVDRFETDQGWTVGTSADRARGGLWVRADPVRTEYQPEDDHTEESGRICYVTGNGAPGGPAGEADVDGGATTLLSPIFDLEGAARVDLSYWRFFVDGGEADDVFTVSISNDAGRTWQYLEWLPWSVPEWGQVSISYLPRVLPLTSRMRLKFVAEDAGAGSLVEAGVDDVEIRARFARGAQVEEPPGPSTEMLRLSLYPNPVRERAELSFTLPERAGVEVRIFDSAGRLLRRIAQDALTPGSHGIVWDLRDGTGRRVPSGTYFARVQAGEAVEERSLIVVR